MSFKETLFCITHLKAAAEAKLRQIETSIEVAGPPAGSTFEEFPKLPINQAATLIREARQKEQVKQPSQKRGV